MRSYYNDYYCYSEEDNESDDNESDDSNREMSEEIDEYYRNEKFYDIIDELKRHSDFYFLKYMNAYELLDLILQKGAVIHRKPNNLNFDDIDYRTYNDLIEYIIGYRVSKRFIDNLYYTLNYHNKYIVQPINRFTLR